MADYQLTHLELSTRINLAMKMLNPEREWGEASALAKEYGVSRKFLYELQDQVWSAIEQTLLPKPAGRKSEELSACKSINPQNDLLRFAGR